MKVGFTGTRRGMNPHQCNSLKETLKKLDPTEFHHGCCVGADTEAHFIVRNQFPGCRIVGHLPNSDTMTDPDVIRNCDEILAPKPHLVRNHDIVDAIETLIAVPKMTREVLRSGTWATIRYCRKQSKPLILINP